MLRYNYYKEELLWKKYASLDITARNIYNVMDVKDFIKNAVKSLDHYIIEIPEDIQLLQNMPDNKREDLKIKLEKKVKQQLVSWTKSKLKSYILEDYEKIERINTLPLGSPDWLENKVKEDQNYLKNVPLYTVDIEDSLWDKFENIIDYFIAVLTENPKKSILNKSFTQALDEEKTWVNEMSSSKDGKDIAGIDYKALLKDGAYTWVDVISEKGLKNEGNNMGHCVGSYGPQVKSGKTKIFSLRSSGGHSRCTIEYQLASNRVQQIKGKQNSPCIPKYWKTIANFLNHCLKKGIIKEGFKYTNDFQKNGLFVHDHKVYTSLEEIVFKGEFTKITDLSREELLSVVDQYPTVTSHLLDNESDVRKAVKSNELSIYFLPEDKFEYIKADAVSSNGRLIQYIKNPSLYLLSCVDENLSMITPNLNPEVQMLELIRDPDAILAIPNPTNDQKAIALTTAIRKDAEEYTSKNLVTVLERFNDPLSIIDYLEGEGDFVPYSEDGLDQLRSRFSSSNKSDPGELKTITGEIRSDYMIEAESYREILEESIINGEVDIEEVSKEELYRLKILLKGSEAPLNSIIIDNNLLDTVDKDYLINDPELIWSALYNNKTVYQDDIEKNLSRLKHMSFQKGNVLSHLDKHQFNKSVLIKIVENHPKSLWEVLKTGADIPRDTYLNALKEDVSIITNYFPIISGKYNYKIDDKYKLSLLEAIELCNINDAKNKKLPTISSEFLENGYKIPEDTFINEMIRLDNLSFLLNEENLEVYTLSEKGWIKLLKGLSKHSTVNFYSLETFRYPTLTLDVLVQTGLMLEDRGNGYDYSTLSNEEWETYMENNPKALTHAAEYNAKISDNLKVEGLLAAKREVNYFMKNHLDYFSTEVWEDYIERRESRAAIFGELVFKGIKFSEEFILRMLPELSNIDLRQLDYLSDEAYSAILDKIPDTFSQIKDLKQLTEEEVVKALSSRRAQPHVVLDYIRSKALPRLGVENLIKVLRVHPYAIPEAVKAGYQFSQEFIYEHLDENAFNEDWLDILEPQYFMKYLKENQNHIQKFILSDIVDKIDGKYIKDLALSIELYGLRVALIPYIKMKLTPRELNKFLLSSPESMLVSALGYRLVDSFETLYNAVKNHGIPIQKSTFVYAKYLIKNRKDFLKLLELPSLKDMYKDEDLKEDLLTELGYQSKESERILEHAKTITNLEKAPPINNKNKLGISRTPGYRFTYKTTYLDGMAVDEDAVTIMYRIVDNDVYIAEIDLGFVGEYLESPEYAVKMGKIILMKFIKKMQVKDYEKMYMPNRQSYTFVENGAMVDDYEAQVYDRLPSSLRFKKIDLGEMDEKLKGHTGWMRELK